MLKTLICALYIVVTGWAEATNWIDGVVTNTTIHKFLYVYIFDVEMKMVMW